MKKLVFSALVLLSGFVMAGCTSQTGSIYSESGTKIDVNVESYRCDADDCGSSDRILQKSQDKEYTIGVKSEIVSIWDMDDEQIKGILAKDQEIGGSNIEIDRNTKTVQTTCGNKSKTFDISLDVTYNNNAIKTAGPVGPLVIKTMFSKLESYLGGISHNDLKLNEGDRIFLKFIGTINYSGAMATLLDTIVLYYGTPCHKDYEIINDEPEYNKTNLILSIYYGLKEKISPHAPTSKDVYTDIDTLMARIKSEFDARYGKNSEGTFLLDHIDSKIVLKDYKEDYITMIFSDFLFQLTQSEKQSLIKIFGAKYLPALYDFSVENISKSREPNYFFKGLYTKGIFKYFPQLNTLCPLGPKNEKMPAYLIGIDTTSDLIVREKMKDFYSNYLFKNCDVKYY